MFDIGINTVFALLGLFSAAAIGFCFRRNKIWGYTAIILTALFVVIYYRYDYNKN